MRLAPRRWLVPVSRPRALERQTGCVLFYNQMVVSNAANHKELDRLFRALADRTRRDIVARALSGEEVSVSTLAARYRMSFAAVQKHVAVLERFWGPEEWPAKFTRHDFTVGGQSHYTMTGPDGARSSGWWRFLAIERPRLIEIEDGFAAADGTPNTAMPTMRMTFTFEPTATGARFKGVTRFSSLESMEQLVKMGMVEGLRSAMGQLDSVLADV